MIYRFLLNRKVNSFKSWPTCHMSKLRSGWKRRENSDIHFHPKKWQLQLLNFHKVIFFFISVFRDLSSFFLVMFNINVNHTTIFLKLFFGLDRPSQECLVSIWRQGPNLCRGEGLEGGLFWEMLCIVGKRVTYSEMLNMACMYVVLLIGPW